MKNLVLTVALLLVGFATKAQEIGSNKTDLRLGVGMSLLGTGDMRAVMVENEANFQLGRYFTFAGGLGYAKSNQGVRRQASFFQLNANIFLSPFTNLRKNDFRLGGGLSWYSVSDVFESSRTFLNGQIEDIDYSLSNRTSFGFNIILEHTYSISEKHLIGFKAFTQPYLNGDMNSGIMLKVGYRL
jgi:hypothetical protein